jgi:putative component of membrane protein insertase Oxa1/YidC/SpoIIIJ protein YidD
MGERLHRHRIRRSGGCGGDHDAGGWGVILPILITVFVNFTPTPAEAGEAASDSGSVSYNPAILAIQGYQLISKNPFVRIVDCPFTPSCSAYGIEAIRSAGTLRGVLYAADRVMRCNPGAGRYYERDAEGRLLDSFTIAPYFESHRAPMVCIPLSFAVPGLNRMVNGRFFDGLTVLTVTGLSLWSALATRRNGSPLQVPCALAFTVFYLSDQYVNFNSFRRK